MQVYQEKAIKLINVDESGKYVLDPEGEKFINNIPSPIAVISVAGLYRTGKSYLLNRMLLNRSNGFGVGPTINPCTKGLWCWGTPIKGTTQEGDKVNVIIIDTEGIGALDEDQNHDTKIFTLAILLASSFIYNSVGSIDQNAVQNLSLIVNLTKNIQLRSHQSQEEDDPDQVSQYFPSFFWVVRDFSLQLINSQGESISSKQYLEKALAPQKGFSDDIQQKNRIRRLLVSFFKQRQCFTLVRPVIGEHKIQHLDELDFDELRPQFVDQVLGFRRRILGRVKPKLMKGKYLDGQMYLNLINSYVSAINNGAVPNIQNAWNYMCNQKCAKLMEESIDIFNRNVNQIFNSNFPCPEQELLMICDRAKDLSYQTFQKYAVGDNSKQYFADLRKKIKTKIKQLKTQNEKQSCNIHKSYVLKNFTSVQKRLKLNQFKNFQEFMKGIYSFYAGLLQNGPNFPQKQFIYLDFLKKIIPQGAEIFLRKSQSEFEKYKTLTEEKQKHLQTTFDSQQKDFDDEITDLNQKNSTLQRDNKQLSLKLQRFSLQIERLIEKYEVEAQSKEKTYKQKLGQMQKRQAQYLGTIKSLRQKFQTSQGQLNQMRKEWEKDKAINELKNKQLTNEVGQMKNKQKSYEITIEKLQSDMESSIKQSAIKFEKKSCQLLHQLKENKDKYTQTAERNAQLEEQVKNIQGQKISLQYKLKEDLQRKQSELSKLRNQLELTNSSFRQQLENQKQQLKTNINKLQSQNTQFLTQIKRLKDISIIQKNEFQKQTAILKQKLQFLQVNLSESKEQFTRMKQYYQTQLYSIQEFSNERISQLQISRIEEAEDHSNQIIKNLQSEIQNHKRKYTAEIQLWKKAKTDLEFQMKLSIANYESQHTQLKSIITKLQHDFQFQLQRKGQSQQKINDQLKNQQQAYLKKIRELENLVEQVKQNAISQQRQNHNKSEDYVMQLKNYYQLQKQKLQQKLSFEREKYQKRIKAQAEQFQGRIQDETGTIQEEYQQLKNDYLNMQTTLQQALSKLQHQSDIKAKNIENLQRIIAESKQKSEKYQKQINHKVEKMVQTHQGEKEALYTKIDQLHQSKNRADKEIMNLSHITEKLQSSLQKKQAQASTLLEDLNSLKLVHQSSQQQHRTKVNDMSNHFMQQKVNYQKMIALAKQQNQFYERKIKEIQKNSESVTTIYQEKLRKIKEQLTNDLHNQSQKYANEMSALEQKYEKQKKLSKETEANMSKIINNHQKQRAIQHEKFSHLQNKLKQYEDFKFNESENYHNQLVTLKSNFSKQKKQSEDLITQLKKQYLNGDSEKNSIVNQYDKDKVLWENKIKFLQENKQKNKKQYSQNIKKLQATIDNLNKTKAAQKNNSQSLHNDHIAKIEKRHWTQIQQLNEAHSKKQSEYQATIKKMEVQIRTIAQKFAFEQQNRAGNQVVSERRLKQLIENEKRLQNQNERLKAEKESQNNDFMTSYERERQNLKNKLMEKQDKLKNMQKMKQNLFFEFEKQRAKWNLEKENFAIRQDELKDAISKNQRDLERLQRQNEKFRVQKKCSKMSLPGSNRYSNYSLERGLSRSSLQTSIQKQNFSPLLGDMSYFKND